MPHILARSTGRKILALAVAIVAFVFAYEARIFDSPYAAWHTLIAEHPDPRPGTRLRFDATAYCKGSTTASGVTVRTGVAAADPDLLPVGSVINVATGVQRYNGVYTVMDTGPKVQGRILDLYMWSCNEALAFGRKEIEVTVLRLGWDPQASSPRLIERLFRRREAAARVPPPEPPPAASGPEPDTVTPEHDRTPVPGSLPAVPAAPANPAPIIPPPPTP